MPPAAAVTADKACADAVDLARGAAVEAGGDLVGVIAEPEFTAIDLPNAEARLEEAIEAGLYTLEAETEFDFLKHYDGADELLEQNEELVAGQPELGDRIRAAVPPLVVREHAVLRRLRA